MDPNSISRIEVRRVPKNVQVTIKEGRGDRVLVNTQLNGLKSYAPWLIAVEHSSKTLVVWANVPDDEKGKVTVSVPHGYKNRTTVRKR